MMYYSKIKIDESNKIISKHYNHSLGYNGELTMSFLKELGLNDNDVFFVYEDENNKEIILSYTLRRLETDNERDERINKEKDYNKRYDEYHKLNK